MLLRREADRRIAITQHSHAALAGQLAAAWGNAAFERPRAETVLAAALHDIGWQAWERAPTRDLATGWPHEFPQVSKLVHVELWRDGVRAARFFGRWPALLVSRHADTIYSRHFDPAAVGPDERRAVRAFLDEQHAVQADLLASLRADPGAADASDAALERARLLLAAVDEMSLSLCWGLDRPNEIRDVPAAPGETAAVSLIPRGAAVAVRPWPFAADRLRVAADGKLLAAPSVSETAMREALARAPAVTVGTDLVPG